MQITHDHSHVSQAERTFIARGYACESLYSLRFSFVLTEAQQAENRACAEQAGASVRYIKDSARRRSEQMRRVVDVLAQNLTICQYDPCILFLRRCDDLDKPFFTIEVRDRKVIQVQGMRHCDPTPEVSAFMAKWERQVLRAA